ncbi:unnamed protein product, partial [marine sediment metagenome]
MRRRLVAALESPWLEYVPKRGLYLPRAARQIARCGLTWGVLHAYEDKSKWMLIPLPCNKVACPRCARLRSIDFALRAARIPDLDRTELRWITFTIENPPPGQLGDTMDRMGKAFSLLRHNKSGEAWSRHVRGYIWGFEITYNAKADTWHPHYHVLYDGRYWP